MPDEGALDALGVARLLAEAWSVRRSGVLRVAAGKRERLITLQEGSPIAVETSGETDRLAQALERAGHISAHDRRRVEQFAADRGCPQISAVLGLKLVESAALYQAVRAEARQQIAECFEWQSGFFQWGPARSAPAAHAKPFDVLSLIQTQLPLRWGNERLFAAVVAIADQRPDVSPRLRRVALQLAEAGPMAARAVAALDGTRPLGKILGEAAGDPLAASTLFTLWHAGILRNERSAGARATTPADALEFEVEIATEASVAVGPTSDAPATGPDPAAPLDAEAQSLRDEIERLAANLGKLDHYAVLGLESDAQAGVVKKAYFKAAKRFHPDSLARKGLAGLEDKAARVFARVSEAFEILTDPDKRAAYDRGASSEPEIDTARLAQAETSFRKGEILLKMGNFQGALEYLQPAVDLWPEEPAYQSALGWALYKQQATDPARARHHLELAHRRTPDDAITMFRLGMVLRALGDHEPANELLQRARSLESSLTG